MVSGDEPQLGGQDHDNAPMISGRGTKIIVSARGAYQVGNLYALVETMNEAQQEAYRLALLGQELWWTQRLIRDVRVNNSALEATLLTRALERILPVAQAWLSNPTSENAQMLLAPLILDGTTGTYIGGRANPYDELVDECLYRILVLMGCEDDIGYDEVISWLGRIASRSRFWSIIRWRLDAAWAIVQNLPSPEHDKYIPLELLFRERFNETRILVTRMNARQHSAFRFRLMQQVSRALTRIMNAQTPIPSWRDLTIAVDRWLGQPNDAHAKHIRDCVERIVRASQMNGLFGLMTVFAPTEDQYRKNLAKAAEATQTVLFDQIEDAATAAGHIVALSFGNRHHYKLHWHLDAAWAILHDQPIPPLEVSAEE